MALMNAGGLRASLPQGPINRAHLKETLPFEKKLVLFKLKGSVIRQILEHGVRFAENMRNDNTGRFLQVAGIKYVFDPLQHAGRRILQVQVYDSINNQYKLLEPDKIYGVVSNSYVAQGGDGYGFFRQALERWTLNIELKELLEIYLKSPELQLPKLEGRIIRRPPPAAKGAPSA